MLSIKRFGGSTGSHLLKTGLGLITIGCSKAVIKALWSPSFNPSTMNQGSPRSFFISTNLAIRPYPRNAFFAPLTSPNFPCSRLTHAFLFENNSVANMAVLNG
jgi:hypothetical protein